MDTNKAVGVAPRDLRVASPWRSSLTHFLLLIAAILLLYRDTVTVMVGIWWRSETFAHAFLVLPISLWLIWRRRDELAALTPRPEPRALLPLLVAATAWLLAKLVVADVVEQFAFVAMLVLTVPVLLGAEVARAVLFPLLFLFFGVPFGEFVVPTMMSLTADFTVTALQASGVPVFREGQHFVIPTGSWSVIDECSGVRYLMASFMVGTLFAYLNYRSYRRRALFMLASLAVPVLANWLRAYLIVMLAYLSGNRLATGVDHIIYGWVFFGFIIFLMFILGARWSEPDAAPLATSGRQAGPPLVHSFHGRVMLATFLAAVVIALLPQGVSAALKRIEGAEAEARIELPPQLADGWSADGAQLVAWAPVFNSPSAQAARVYASHAGGVVGVHIAYYRGQGEGRKLVSSTNRLVPMRNDEWNLLPSDGRDVTAGRRTVRVNTAEVRALAPLSVERRPHLMVWQFYWIDGRFIAGDAAAKIAGGLSRLQGHGDEGASVVLYADGATVAESNATLEAFLEANLDRLNAVLQRTHDTR